MVGRPCRMSESGREALLKVWEALPEVWEASPKVWEWLGHPAGCP